MPPIEIDANTALLVEGLFLWFFVGMAGFATWIIWKKTDKLFKKDQLQQKG